MKSTEKHQKIGEYYGTEKHYGTKMRRNFMYSFEEVKAVDSEVAVAIQAEMDRIGKLGIQGCDGSYGKPFNQ